MESHLSVVKYLHSAGANLQAKDKIVSDFNSSFSLLCFTMSSPLFPFASTPCVSMDNDSGEPQLSYGLPAWVISQW